VLTQLRGLNRPVYGLEDLEGVTGIGDRIQAKIVEIVATGELAAAEKIKKNPKNSVQQDFLKVYGIGPVKAKALVDDVKLKLESIADLRAASAANPDLLNDKQKIGLKYYEDILERIPRSEVEAHDRVIESAFKATDTRFIVTVVGSYRRKAETSGDIDVLVTVPRDVSDKDALVAFKKAIIRLQETGYITDVLAIGNKKCMAVSRLPSGRARRLDVLLTPPAEYAYALLYFTGSDKFNIQFRKITLEQGYSLSEHGAKKVDASSEIPEAPYMDTERDIFDYFKIPYLPPESR
jgi:DNA polymerase beta